MTATSVTSVYAAYIVVFFPSGNFRISKKNQTYIYIRKLIKPRAERIVRVSTFRRTFRRHLT